MHLHLENDANLCQAKLQAAEKLVVGLEGENKRWLIFDGWSSLMGWVINLLLKSGNFKKKVEKKKKKKKIFLLKFFYFF